MNRRNALKKMGVAGGMALIAGCVGADAISPSSDNLTIEYRSDTEPDSRRILSITIGTYEPENFERTESIPPTWVPEIRYQSLYRVAPGEKLTPEIFVGEPGRYQFNMWLEERGGIGTEVEITSEGKLEHDHHILITSEGMEHSRS